jgi:hypothetical protein
VSAFATEFPFTLPMGYVDDDGTLHREGTMRLATAADEILPLRDPRVRANESYLTVILLSRVVTTLGSLPDVTPATVEGLFVPDLAHLQELYGRVNTRGADAVDVVCPECGESFELALGPDGATAPADASPESAGHDHGDDPSPVTDTGDGVDDVEPDDTGEAEATPSDGTPGVPGNR